MRRIFIYLIFVVALNSCKKDKNTNVKDDWFYIEVRSSANLDCGVPEIIFLDRQQEAYQIIGDSKGVYNATGLPKVFYPPGTRMYVSIQKPTNSQLLMCTAMGPSYPQVFINSVK